MYDEVEDLRTLADTLREQADEWTVTETGEDGEDPDPATWDDYAGELTSDDVANLANLAEQVTNAGPIDRHDFYAIADALQEYGDNIDPTMIRDDYFTAYAEELADDCGMIDKNAGWPMRHLDWDAAAEELKQDYISVTFGGYDYWIRA